MVWQKTACPRLFMYHFNRKTPDPTKDGKRRGSREPQESTVKYAASNTTSASEHPTASNLEDGDDQSPVRRSDSILSGELGDSECSTQRSDDVSLVPILKTPSAMSKQRRGSTRTAHKRRSSKPRQVSALNSSVKPSKKASSKTKKRTIKICKPSQSDSYLRTTNLELDRTFDVPFRREPLENVLEKSDRSGTELQTQELATEGKVSSDSEEYETDLEDRFGTPPLWSQDATGRLRYLTLCERLKLAPCSVYLRQAVEEKLNLRYYGLSPKQLLPLAMSFMDNTYVSHLDLSYNDVGTDGILYLARCLKENIYITYIEFSFCFLGKETNGARAVHKLLQSSDNIHQLNLSHNCFRSRDYVWFAQLLQLPSRLTSLDLSDNELGPGGSEVFAEALAENGTLLELILDWNPLFSVGAENILKATSKNSKLTQLSLVHTGFTNSVFNSVVNLLCKNESLTQLDLRHNHLFTEGIEEIKRAMDKRKNVIEIKFY